MKHSRVSSRRGERGGPLPGCHRRDDENWTSRPHDDRNHDTRFVVDAFPSSSSSSLGYSRAHAYAPRFHRTSPRAHGRNTRWTPRIRGGRLSNLQCVEKSEPASFDSYEEGGVKEDTDHCGVGYSSSLKVASNGGAVELASSSSSNNDPKGVTKCKDDCSSESGHDLGGREVECSEQVDSVTSRFQELMLTAEETELSEEQIKSNDESQEDELLVLESIYGDSISVLDKLGGLRCFQVCIYIDAPEELTISAKLNSPNDLACDTDESSGFSYSYRVKYLAPIILNCLFPKSYPSHQSPYFTISIQWLNAAQISKLCSMLDSIWKEQLGSEVIYLWVDWLHNFSLSYLGFDQEVVLGPYGVKHFGERRAISGCLSPEIDIPFMKSYNDDRCLENFRKNIHTCGICFNEYAGIEFIKLPCQHFFCCKCMKTFSAMHVKEGTINQLLCPEAKCGGMIPPTLLKHSLSEEEFERWESVTLQKTLESMSDVSYCPRCETACIEDEDQHAQCSKCFYSFCTLCREPRHVGLACMTPEMKLLLLKERQNSSLREEQRRRERDMINELLSVKEINRTSKQCPSCRISIEKTEGCNKMTCRNCGQYFCYKCNNAIDDYGHFREGKCELFPQAVVQAWEERINPRQVLNQIQAELFPERGQSSCPSCGQLNIKVGNNNHILCWACQTHFCYICRKIVKRSSQHYGPKGCKQHTVG